MRKNTGCNCKETNAGYPSGAIAMLTNLFPLLKNQYRDLDESEIESETVFKELFPNNEVDFGILKAVYQYQQLKIIQSK
ncbi:hypothetical protein GKZ90_0021025 [Flavobacterium sp. MC2016-06]|uniref:hypothetical protein n=1 Tax=Flavobacterium sp. MC2016-06 TaxID=2676308 RepID=UPI0012BAFC81|nr:hypothetical protein [Flavobacterium sp. MC2016-06]MBU3860984.1 hypothetical protein [Flavobacterium sp. MC2016-06]